ncbi:MAG: hypothetical protein JAY90_21250 [Candidatus Thiodiazotropha lotti]|nr:hypothetical protein [Candidatus Thiodiazotropha lotti]
MNKSSLLTVLSIILVLTGGCYATTKAIKPDVETLHGLSLTSTHLSFSVTSNGCTDLDSFDVLIQRIDMSLLSVVRKKEDTCRRKRNMIDIKYPLSKLNINSTTAFTITNPFAPFQKQKYK